MDTNKQFVLVTPSPGRESFPSHLILALFYHTAPTQVWVNTAQEQPCFIMESSEFQNWAKRDCPIDLLAPSLVSVVVDDSPEINEFMAKSTEIASQRSVLNTGESAIQRLR